MAKNQNSKEFEAGYQNCIKILEQILIEVYSNHETLRLPVKEWDVESVMLAIVNEYRALGDIVHVPTETQEED